MTFPRIAMALLALSCATPAMARISSSPDAMRAADASVQTSNVDSNITPRDTRSRIAPRLPMPSVGMNASAPEYLRAAQTALGKGQTGLAQQALEMAETRILNRSVAADEAGRPIQDPRVQAISDALHALGDGSLSRSLQTVGAALSGNYDIARMQ